MRAGWHTPGLCGRLRGHQSTFDTIEAMMASTCEHAHGASAPRPRRAAVRAGSHHAPASAAISASAWPPRARPQLVTSLKRRPTKISEQNRNSEYEMHLLADAKNALTKPLALISFCYCFVSRLAPGRFFRGYATSACGLVTLVEPCDLAQSRGSSSLEEFVRVLHVLCAFRRDK